LGVDDALLNFSPNEQHGSEPRLAEPAGVDRHGPIELEGDRLVRYRAADDVGKARQAGEADGEIERNDRFLRGAERQAQGEVARGRLLALEQQRGVERAQRKAEGVRISDADP
jgi:hypothetical protein